MFVVLFAVFAVTAEENEQLLKTSLLNKKKEQFNLENKAGKKNKRKMQIRNCGNETRLAAASFSCA